MLETIKQVAPFSANVLIEGESGTGKELAAHAIHNLSRRNKAKFVVVHCAALSPQLLESELFGHEKGAFTGAHERRIGRFEQANGGTLFLDEIAEIDPSTQVKLLRVMSEERAFERVGGNQTLRADVRLIAATNKNLEQLVREGKFRDDLYFRLNVVRIVMPPLRERKEDIPILVRGFLRHFCKENQKPLLELAPDAMDALLTYDWPGNIRELRTAIEHGVVMATGKQITLRDLPMAVRQAATAKIARRRFTNRGVRRKNQPARSARDGKKIDCPGTCRHERQRHRRCQKARHQPPHASSKNQRNESVKKISRSRRGNVEAAPTLPVPDPHTQQRPRQPFAWPCENSRLRIAL